MLCLNVYWFDVNGEPDSINFYFNRQLCTVLYSLNSKRPLSRAGSLLQMHSKIKEIIAVYG